MQTRTIEGEERKKETKQPDRLRETVRHRYNEGTQLHVACSINEEVEPEGKGDEEKENARLGALLLLDLRHVSSVCVLRKHRENCVSTGRRHRGTAERNGRVVKRRS